MPIAIIFCLILFCGFCGFIVLNNGNDVLSKNEKTVSVVLKIITIVLTLWFIIACASPWNNDYEYIYFEKNIKITKIYKGNKQIGFRINSSDNQYEIKVIKDAVYLDYNERLKKIRNVNLTSFILNNLNNEKLYITIKITKHNCVKGIDFLLGDDATIVKREVK